MNEPAKRRSRASVTALTVLPGRSASELRAILARLLIAMPAGERLPTVREFAKTTGASVGSVQGALAELAERGAVSLHHRGHLGAFLVEQDLGRLWEAAEGSPLVIALPLSNTDRIQGLATGLKAQLRTAGIETFSIFIAGSRHRLETLRRGGCHATVMSDLAAGKLCGEGEAGVLRLPPQSYVGEHRVLERKRARRQPRRAVIDERSIDQQVLSQLEFADHEIETVSAAYMQFGRLLETRAADVAVWSVDEVPERLRDLVRMRPLSERTRAQIGDRDTRAQVVTTRNAGTVEALLAGVLDADELTATQRAVMDGRVVAEY